MPSSRTVTASRPSGKSAAATAQDLRAQAARTNAAEHRRVTSRLRQALEQDEFALLYQRQTHLATGAVRGAEAMICLRHRRRGLIPPGHFMPVAEDSDIAIQIGNWAIARACQDAAQARADFFLTVPVSHRQLLSGKVVKQVVEGLAGWDLDAARLELAVTEAMLIDENEDVNFALKALRGLGVGLVLDSFGTSYASLSLLKRLPLTMLKLDRSMIAGLPGSRETAAILSATVQTAHALRIGVIADGLENEEQRRLLVEFGCDFAQSLQGNPPVPFAELALR